MRKQKNALVVQDISCLGKCSMTIAVPIISACGITTTLLPTALLSTHGGFKNPYYKDLSEDVKAILNHFDSLNVEFDAIYSGFLSSIEQIENCVNLANNHKNALMLVDPVMADNGKFYSVYNSEMLGKMKELCKVADVLVPNLTEAAFLLDEEYIAENYSKEYIENILKKLFNLGAKNIVLTGVSFEKDKIGAACFDGEKTQYIFSNKLDGSYHGTGDIFASTLLSALLNGLSLEKSTKIAVDYVAHCIKTSIDMNIDKNYGVAFELELKNLINKF